MSQNAVRLVQRPTGSIQNARYSYTISSRDIDRHADNGDAVGAIVGRMLELFAEYVRIDFFVVDANILDCETRAQHFAKQVLAAEDRGAGVEHKAPTRREPSDALLDDVQG